MTHNFDQPLCGLLSANYDFTGSSQQQAAFEKVKKEIWRTMIFRYFDLKEPIMIQVDASTAGVNAALLQNEM